MFSILSADCHFYFADQMKKVFIGYAIVCGVGAIAFGLSRYYIHKNHHDILAARERIYRESLLKPETEDTPLWHRKEYRDKHKTSNSS